MALRDHLTPDEFAILAGVYERELALDEWLPLRSRTRRRAYQRFALAVGELTFTPDTDPGPYIQSMSVNPLQGGIERVFELIPPEHPVTAVTAKIAGVVAESLRTAGVLDAVRAPEVEVDIHFIRISAPGEPAPEGVHRDGLLGGSVHLVHRENMAGGVSEVYETPEQRLDSFELAEPMDSFLFDDARVLHYTHPIAAADPERAAHRDVLLTGFREP
ncbi:2OG-Fe dioxygenase family protein [Nocardia sp.]|uniref:2OG-Fe dioxygenase family protein n=1 Tax=Nocardia sp. TaxID=1821 RepID=UPI00260F552D|nr:2OG-Fe dioxygenase family protein [Nocardia sp.]